MLMLSATASIQRHRRRCDGNCVAYGAARRARPQPRRTPPLALDTTGVAPYGVACKPKAVQPPCWRRAA